MPNFLSYDFAGGPFQLFSTTHLVALLLIAALNAFFILQRKTFDEKTRRVIRYTLAAALVLNEISWHVWHIMLGKWTIQEMLPLHLCSVLVWTGAYMLVKKDPGIYEFAFLLGIPGAMQGFLTPDLGIYDFPHYRYFQTFISHGLIVTAAVYMTAVEGYRPYPRSIRNIFVYGNLYMLAVSLVNWAIGSNYLFTAHKPPTASLLDVLPAWPWYLVFVELIALVCVLILYTPFFIKDRLKEKRKPISVPL
jgi:hypothetical integral membrane protein (TIGR02206 family)